MLMYVLYSENTYDRVDYSSWEVRQYKFGMRSAIHDQKDWQTKIKNPKIVERYTQEIEQQMLQRGHEEALKSWQLKQYTYLNKSGRISVQKIINLTTMPPSFPELKIRKIFTITKELMHTVIYELETERDLFDYSKEIDYKEHGIVIADEKIDIVVRDRIEQRLDELAAIINDWHPNTDQNVLGY